MIRDPLAGSGQILGPAIRAASGELVLTIGVEAPPVALRDPYLIDTSVWARMSVQDVAQRVQDVQALHTIATVTPVLLEVGFSAQTPEQLSKVHEQMRAFTVLHPTKFTHDIALGIQEALWGSGKVRAAGAFDTLVAALAMENDATVLHYDHDYEHIASAVPGFKQEAVAPWGSLP